MDVFDLSAKISLDTSEYKNALTDASDTSAGFGSKISGGFSTAMKTGAVAIGAMVTAVAGVSTAMVGAINDVASYGDAIDKNSQKMGVSSQFYQEWDAVLQHSGTSMDAMSGTFKKLSTAVQNGSADQQEAFAKLGLSMDELANMSTEEVFAKTIEGLQGMEEGTERTALATQLLGKGAMEMGALLNTSAEDTQAMIDTVNQLGGVMGNDAVKASARFEDSMQDLQTVFKGAKNNMVAEFLPAVSDVVDGLTAIFSGDSNGIDMVKQGIEGFVDSFEEMMPKVQEIMEQLMPLITEAITTGLPVLLDCASDILLALVDGIITNLPMLIDASLKIIDKLVFGLIEMLPKLADGAIQIVLSLADGIVEALPDLIPAIVGMIAQIVTTLTDPENLGALVEGALMIVMAIAQGIVEALPVLIEALPQIIENIIIVFTDNLPLIMEMGVQILGTLIVGLVKAIPTLVKAIPKIVVALVKGFTNLNEKFREIGKNIVEGIKTGIANAWDKLVDWIVGLCSKLVDKVKSFFGIASPSKVFKEIGGFLAEGLGVGWNDEIGDVKQTITQDLDFSAVPSALSIDLSQTTKDMQNMKVENNVTITLEGDAKRLFKAMQSESATYKAMTGQTAFA